MDRMARGKLGHYRRAASIDSHGLASCPSLERAGDLRATDWIGHDGMVCVVPILGWGRACRGFWS